MTASTSGTCSRTPQAQVAVFTWNLQPDLIERALAHGARGYLSKALSGEEIVEALEAIQAGEVVTALAPSATSVHARQTGPARTSASPSASRRCWR